MKELNRYISDNESISIRKQCELLGINRSNIYYKAATETTENLHLMRLMDEYFLEHPTYGVLQMQDYLSGLGFIVNHKRVRRLLRKMSIMAIYPKRNLSKLGQSKYIRPYLLKGLTVEKPNQVWATDITYIPMEKGFMYLSAIIDLYSRFVVSWDIFNNLEAENNLSILKTAISKYGKPKIINSDQGSQFTSILWTEYIDNQDIKISMDGKGRAIDNIFIERLWRTVKRDYIYIKPPEDGLDLYLGLENFFTHYNFEKTHQGIGRLIPTSLYQFN